jgi:hypothetical protein
MDEPPTENEISELKRTVTQQRVEYLRLIRDQGFAIDEAELARFEAELAAPQKRD